VATQRRSKKKSTDEDEAPRRKRRTSSSSSTSKKVIPIDFTKAEGGGGAKRYKEGDYVVTFVKHEFGRSKNADTPYVEVGLEFKDGKYKGQVWSGQGTRLYLSDASVWRVRSFLEAMGVTVPKKKANVDFSKYYGKDVGITIVDGEPYNGRIKSEIADFVEPDALGDEDEEDFDEDEEEEDTDDDEEEDEDEDDDEDDEDMEELDVDDDL
jgi:hypothetical protein